MLRWGKIALAPIGGIAAFTTTDAPDAQDADLLAVLRPWPDHDNAVHWTDQLSAQWPLTSSEDVELRDWLYSHECRWDAAHASLAELAPVLGGEVPLDPFDGAPTRYDAARRLVWVVGVNPTDGGGTPTPWNARYYASRYDEPDPGWQLPE